ncbi:MAG: hypothetical protein ACM3O3_06315 [Syntrophothermus sp.]
MKFLSILFIIILYSASFAQDTTFTFDDYNISVTNGILSVEDSAAGLTFTKKFSNPVVDVIDLDDDGVNEILIKDFTVQNSKNNYSIYVCKDLENGFAISDSIESGSVEPYSISSDSMEYVLVTGNPKFDKYNENNEEVYSPINCWKYEGNQLVLINDEFYDIFINENENIINYLDEYFDVNKKDCNSSKAVLAAIVSAYINYLNAEEHTLALQIIQNYYFCTDKDNFKKQLDILNEE